ncbi:MAG: cytochrome c [Nitrospirae bacterium CG_4_9_14_3_um_filter_51_5]|nr:MAG: cytochrome c [Nitrospirae bacterium CG_4_9_14_3_um_filter_51_5]
MKEKGYFARSFLLPAILLCGSLTSCMADRHPTADRVPSYAMEEAVKDKAPFGDARKAPLEVVEAGKKLFEGQGRCITCHGKGGTGDGPAAHLHKPAPRDFTDCKFQKSREDGKLFWIIKHGSPGTGMQAMIPNMVTEEQGWQLVAYVRSFCKAQG